MAQISYIKYKDVLEAHRYDPECFVILSSLKHKYHSKNIIDFSNKNYIEIIDGDRGQNYPHSDDFSPNGYCLFLNTSNVLSDGFNLNGGQFITKAKDEILGGGKLKRNDIVFTTRGTIGNIGIYNEFIEYQNLRINSGMVIFRLTNLNPNFFFAFLLTDYFKKQIKAYSSGSVQSQIPIQTIKKLKIHLFPESFQIKIEQIVKSAYQKQTESKRLYHEAEELLLKELGLLDYKVKHTLTFSTTKKEIDEAHRYDSEYFQPKYAEIIKKIEKYEGGWDLVKNQFTQNTTLSKKNGEYCNYIEISDINTSNGEITPNKVETKDIPANGKRKLFKNDLLISKVRPYRGAIAFIDFEVENLIGSGAFTVLQEKTDYKKEVLMIFFKTQFIKDLLLRYNCGTSYPVIKDEDILNIKIPLIKQSIQNQIAEKIRKSHKLRNESKSLLEEAKRKVEEEIEK